MDNNGQKQPAIKWAKVILYLLAIVLIAVFVWFIADLNNLYRSGVIRSGVSRLHRRSAARPTLQPQQIGGWMTFRYVNYVFRLPANYLSTKLNITGSGYPGQTLDQYASDNKLDRTAFVGLVRQAVAAYNSGALP